MKFILLRNIEMLTVVLLTIKVRLGDLPSPLKAIFSICEKHVGRFVFLVYKFQLHILLLLLLFFFRHEAQHLTIKKKLELVSSCAVPLIK